MCARILFLTQENEKIGNKNFMSSVFFFVFCFFSNRWWTIRFVFVSANGLCQRKVTDTFRVHQYSWSLEYRAPQNSLIMIWSLFLCFILLFFILEWKSLAQYHCSQIIYNFYVCLELTKKEIDVIIVPKGDYCVVSVCTLV